MGSNETLFKIDVTQLLRKARKTAANHLGDVTLNLPFVSIAVKPGQLEQRVAREIVIRMRDRRVLSAYECCDGCIDHALTSLNEIRQMLVEKQVELADLQDGPLYLLIDMMREAIRQFQTYEQLLNRADAPPDHSPFRHFERPLDVRQAYFGALEVLRGHLARCLEQVALTAKMNLAPEGVLADYQGPWVIAAYVALEGGQ